MKIYSKVIDYSLVKRFDIKLLKKDLILPIQSNGIYLNCFICKESNLKLFENESIIKSEQLSAEEIKFFLSDIDLRVKLYELSLNSLNNEKFESSYIKEFFFLVLKNAIENRVSDIHIESSFEITSIRYRIDGRLKLFYTFSKKFLKVLSSYIKVASKLDLTQSRVAMDGSFSKNIDGKKYDFRVSTMPTINGESIVIRVLDNTNMKKDISSLGFNIQVSSAIKNILNLTQGLVLISGPTGSGKSTTLYSILKSLNVENRKIITVEDPVEYKIEQVQQIEVNEEIGFSFENILRNILRQDPDTILIGEIRDSLSLAIALQASLTGHLVLSSIHANNSFDTLTRLIDLNADTYLLSNSLKYVISQRLVLKNCEICDKEGCKECNFTGFKGRTTISEVLKVDAQISSMINKNRLHELKLHLDEIDFKTMLYDGKEKVKKSVCTIEEVYKVIES